MAGAIRARRGSPSVTFRKRAYELVRKRTRACRGAADRQRSRHRAGAARAFGNLPRRLSRLFWTARNVDERPIEAGREAIIARVDGLILMVRSAA